MGPLSTAMKAALRNDGHIADLWLAYALAQADVADGSALAAAAKAPGEGHPWVLPVVLLRVAAKMGATDEAAAQVAAEMVASGEPQRLFGVLSGLGVPVGALAGQFRDLDHAIGYGAHIAHAHAAIVNNPQGSLKRRVAKAVDQLVEGLSGPAPALLKALVAREVRNEWALWVAAIASYLRGKSQPGGHGGADIVHDVLYHGEGSDPVAMSKARRAITPAYRADLANILSDVGGWNVPPAVLAMPLVRGDAELARLVTGMHPGTTDADHRIVALVCAAGWHDADSVPVLIGSDTPARRLLGLILAEWVPTAEVLEALLRTPVPADPLLRLQYARALASTGEAAVVPVFEAMLAADSTGALDEPRRLAEEILRTPIAR
jgi:hypothetical protein